MKRCPECGYHIHAEELRDCPLCGVRMRNEPGGYSAKPQTHVHTAEGERCLLPNTTEEEAAKNRYRTVMEKQLQNAGSRPVKVEMNKQLKQLIGIAVVLILYALIGSCSA